jgi:alpha-ketoglutarate-dependent taurine dioxygenase
MVFNLNRYRKIRVESVTGTVGAGIFDVDIANLDDDTFAEIRDAFNELSVPFFRDQTLGADSFGDFVRRFRISSANDAQALAANRVGRMHRAPELPSTTRNHGDRCSWFTSTPYAVALPEKIELS